MNKKIFTLALTALLIGASSAYAAPKHRPADPNRPTPEMMEIKLIEQLKLTPEQYNAIQERRKADHEKIKPLMEKAKEIRQQMNEIRKANMKAFEDILTPEQKAEFDKIKAERKARHEERMKKHPRPEMRRGHFPPKHIKRPTMLEDAPTPMVEVTSDQAPLKTQDTVTEDAPAPMVEDAPAPMVEDAPAPEIAQEQPPLEAPTAAPIEEQEIVIEEK